MSEVFSTTVALGIARRYANRNMTALVRISRMAAPTPDESGSSTATVSTVVYEGRGRLSQVSGPLTMGLGDVPSYYSTTFLSIPIATSGVDPVINDMVEVLSSRDEVVDGRWFKVTNVEAGGLFPVVHRLQLTGFQSANRPADSSIPAEWLL